MDILNVVIVAALLMTVGLIGTGIWSISHGREFDQKHSTLNQINIRHPDLMTCCCDENCHL